jgi:hypothetical protein
MTEKAPVNEDAAATEDAIKEIEARVEDLFIDEEADPTAGAARIFLNFKVSKPKPTWWFRVHPDDAYSKMVWSVEDEDTEEKLHLIVPTLRNAVPPQALRRRKLFAAITRNGLPFVWPAGYADASGQTYPAWTAALEAAEHARTNWTQMAWSRAENDYVISHPTVQLPDPEWPDPYEYPFGKWVDLAFKNLTIRDPDHILLQKLRGEA